ncbi:MAG: glycoside hydrolase family 43 protein [Acidobacteriota bacterium]|nr:glycoside hydrolase family 43 protein [Acidobacteriota bacterium]
MRETRIGLRSEDRAFSDGRDSTDKVGAGCEGRRFVICALLLLSLILSSATGQSQKKSEAARESAGESSAEALLFAYFKGNGEDGLHFAHSDDGLTWRPVNNGQPLLKPAVGRDKLMRDPHITVATDGTYHMVWTSSWKEPVIGYATSRDLIRWSEQRAITPMSHEPAVRNVWAPETFYDPATNQFLLFWSSTIPGRFPATDRSGGNGLNHRIYYTTTKDFKGFAPTRLLYDKGFNVIDATIIEEGGRYVMFIKDETREPAAQKNIRYAVSLHAKGPYSEPSPPITGQYWAEGPSAIRAGARWVVYFDKYTEHRYGAVASSDMKHWEDISAQIKFPEGARHGTILRVSRNVLSKLLNLK